VKWGEDFTRKSLASQTIFKEHQMIPLAQFVRLKPRLDLNFYLTSFIVINSIFVGWQLTSAAPLESIHLVKRGLFDGSKKPRLTRVTTHNQKLQDAGWVFATSDGKAPRMPVPRVRDRIKSFTKSTVQTVKQSVKNLLRPDSPTGKPTTTPRKMVDLNNHPAPTSPRERKRLEDAGFFIS